MTTGSIKPLNIQVLDYMVATHGVNPYTIYCQITGKPLGRMFNEEVDSLLDPSMDAEENGDAMLVRTLASMRPSINWNVMREDSLKELMVKQPRETLCYLLNRLFQPAEFHKVGLAQRLGDHHNRIRLFDFITDSLVNGDDSMVTRIRTLMTLLIELDAKINLSVQTVDLRVEDFMLFFDKAEETLLAFYAARIKWWNRQQKLELDERRWAKGNTLARPAFAKLWQDAKPESKTAAVKREKKQRDNVVDSYLAELLGDDKPEAEVATPAPAPVKPASKLPAFLLARKA